MTYGIGPFCDVVGNGKVESGARWILPFRDRVEQCIFQLVQCQILMAGILLMTNESLLNAAYAGIRNRRQRRYVGPVEPYVESKMEGGSELAPDGSPGVAVACARRR
jgi:hypothetical protein